MPLISVIMAVYNCEEFVREAVNSVLEQTERNLELIVVNDGSTDATLPILEELSSQDCRVRVHTQTNSGKPSIARNAGIRRATGEFIAFIDGDDIFHPKRLERELDVFRCCPEVGLVFSDLTLFSTDAEKYGTGLLTKKRLLDIAGPHMSSVGNRIYVCAPSFYNCMSTCAFGVVTTLTAMVRHSVLVEESEWFPQYLTTYEDNDLWLRLALRSRFAYVDEVLAYYRRHASNITSNTEKMSVGAIEARLRNFERGKGRFSEEEVQYCRRRLSVHFLYLGDIKAQNGDREGARRSYLRSVGWWPTGRVIPALLKTFVPARLLQFLRKALGR